MLGSREYSRASSDETVAPVIRIKSEEKETKSDMEK
jgi:hypothetical protein